MNASAQNGEVAGGVSNVFSGYVTGGEDETSLWLRGAGGGGGDNGTSCHSGDEGFLTSLDEGGNLMSAGGGWTVGEDGLQWSGVKTEQVFDAWAAGSSGRQQATASELMMKSSPLLLSASTAAAAAALAAGGEKGSGGDDNDGQSSSPIKPLVAASELQGCADLYAEKKWGKFSPPPSSAQTASAKGSIRLPASQPTPAHSAGSSTKDNIAAFAKQRSSLHIAVAADSADSAATASKTTTTRVGAAVSAAATAAAAAAATAAAAAAAAAPPPPPPPPPPPALRTRTSRRAAAAHATVKTELAEAGGDKDGGEKNNSLDQNEDVDCGGTGGSGSGRRKNNHAAAAAAAKKSAHVKSRDSEDDDLDLDLDPDDPVGSELIDKRRRNREHAKRSRLRKRVRLGGLEQMVLGLRRENMRLRRAVMTGIPDRAAAIIRTCAEGNTNPDVVAKRDVVQGMRPGMSVGSSSSSWSARGGTRKRPKVEGGSSSSSIGGGASSSSKDHFVPSALKLMSPSYHTVKALVDSQANFILTNPNLPDCPIIFASQGFLELTGYEGRDVIGKNWRFLNGPGTDPETLSIARNNVAAGRDASVCILNYKKDGTPFWNQLSIGVLLDAHGQVANHVGVMCEVNQMPPAVFHRLLHRVPLPESLLHDSSGSDSDGEEDERAERGRISGGSFKASKPAGRRSRRSSSGHDDDDDDDDGDDGEGSGGAGHAPKVVDRLRRTRAAAAIIKNSGSSS